MLWVRRLVVQVNRPASPARYPSHRHAAKGGSMAQASNEPLGDVRPLDWKPYLGATCYVVRSACRDAVAAYVVRYPDESAFCLMCIPETGCPHTARLAGWLAGA